VSIYPGNTRKEKREVNLRDVKGEETLCANKIGTSPRDDKVPMIIEQL
jgi:hypothetical protein